MRAVNRRLKKTLTWRVVASITTGAVTYLLTGNVVTSLSVSFANNVIKTALYWLHERLWGD